MILFGLIGDYIAEFTKDIVLFALLWNAPLLCVLWNDISAILSWWLGVKLGDIFNLCKL